MEKHKIPQTIKFQSKSQHFDTIVEKNKIFSNYFFLLDLKSNAHHK